MSYETATNFRSVKTSTRHTLHRTMQVKAYQIDLDSPASVVAPVHLRVHNVKVRGGDMVGFVHDYAEEDTEDPRLIFLVEDHTPTRGDVYWIDSYEAYQVENVDFLDTVTVEANVIRLREAEAASYASIVATYQLTE